MVFHPVLDSVTIIHAAITRRSPRIVYLLSIDFDNEFFQG